MDSIINFDNLTLNPEEARGLSECVQEQLYVKPELTKIHAVTTGVTMNKYIPIFGKYGLVGKADPGSCGVNTETGKIPVSQKMWEPKPVSFRLQHCQADLPALLKMWRAKKAKDQAELIESEEMAFIQDRVLDATYESILRLTEFGDTAADVVANGGNLTAGTDKAYFTVINGMWKQIFVDQALGTPLSKRYVIDVNTADSTAAQLALGDGEALNIFRNLYNKADTRIFQGNPVFQVTKTIFDNWQDFMEDKSQVFQLDRTEAGSSKWTYRGIPIVVRDDWDRMIEDYFDQGDTLLLPHRAIFTSIENIPIGTSDTESLSALSSWYERKDKAHYVDVAYNIDQKNLMEKLLSVAY